jgi:hypothetical protein
MVLERLRGKIIARGEPEYDKERKIWNGMIDRKPRLIVKCADTSDAIQAAGYAKKKD